MARDSNVRTSVRGKKLTIEIDLAGNLGRSGSGKNILVATTHGPVRVEGTNVKVVLTAYRPPLRARPGAPKQTVKAKPLFVVKRRPRKRDGPLVAQ